MSSRPSAKPILAHALKLLARRDHSVLQIRTKLHQRFESQEDAVDEVIGGLVDRRYLDDERFARNLVERGFKKGRPQLQMQLEHAGISTELAARILDSRDWPSIGEAVEAKMKSLKLSRPLKLSDAGRLSRALGRLGYEADEVRSEVEKLL